MKSNTAGQSMNQYKRTLLKHLYKAEILNKMMNKVI